MVENCNCEQELETSTPLLVAHVQRVQTNSVKILTNWKNIFWTFVRNCRISIVLFTQISNIFLLRSNDFFLSVQATPLLFSGTRSDIYKQSKEKDSGTKL